MRQRKIKNVDKKLRDLSDYMTGLDNKGRWWEVFAGRKGDIYVEIGCGKGRFINELAKNNREACYIGVEGHSSVILRALQKAEHAELRNIIFSCGYIKDLRDVFEDDEIDGIYLNFSDPWPKKRHAKRRLTHRKYLKSYMQVVKPGGFIQFKTDNDDLFGFTLEEIESCGYEIEEISRDLHTSEYSAKDVLTEYESKFMLKGEKINYVKIKVAHKQLK